MFHHSTVTGRRVRKLDFMAGSERMLKAHHKNAVFHKSLEDKKSVFDTDCHKRLSKVQHEIYDIYFNEFVPLKEEANRIQQRLPNIHNGAFVPKLKKLASIPGKNGVSCGSLPAVHSLCLVSSAYKDADVKNKQTDSFLDILRQQELERSKNKKKLKKKTDTLETEASMSTPCSFWPESDSDDSLPVDKKRLKILKTAIALTSQPAKSPEPRKPRRLRKSFLISLRRHSKLVWEEDLLKRIGAPSQRNNPKNEASDEGDMATKTEDDKQGNSKLLWRTSFSKNKILNDSDGSESEQNLSQFLESRMPESHQLRMSQTIDRRRSRSRASTESILSESHSLHRRSVSRYMDAPLHDFEDLHCSESSPDIFSVISEATGSYSTGSSFATGSSGDDSESYYSSSEDF